jgi:hypothetical protein
MPIQRQACFGGESRVRILLDDIRFQDNLGDRLAQGTYIVALNEAAAVTGSSVRPCVGTTSLSACVALAFHDQEMQVAAVTHVELQPFTPILEPVDKMLSRLLEMAKLVGGARYDALVFNARLGQRTWSSLLVSHIDALMGGLAASGAIRGFKHRDEMNFIMDSRDGSVYTGLD